MIEGNSACSVLPQGSTTSVLGIATGQTENEGDSTYPPIYFPGTPNAQEAARIEVVAGGQLSGIDIPLSETKAFSVSGKVFRSDGKPAVEAMLSNTRMDDGDWGGWM